MFVVYDLGASISVTIRVPVDFFVLVYIAISWLTAWGETFRVLGALGCQYTRVVFHSLSLKMFKLFGLHFVKIKDRVDNN